MGFKNLICLALLSVTFCHGEEAESKKGVNSVNGTLALRLEKFGKLAKEMESSTCGEDQRFPGWLRCGNYLYSVTDRPMTWEEAHYICAMRNGRLAAKGLREDDVFDFLRNYIVELDIKSSGGHWVGLTDIHSEGNWVYEDNVYAVSTNTKWNSGEPNNHKGEDCAELLPSSNLNDVGCEQSRRALCEFDLDD